MQLHIKDISIPQAFALQDSENIQRIVLAVNYFTLTFEASLFIKERNIFHE